MEGRREEGGDKEGRKGMHREEKRDNIFFGGEREAERRRREKKFPLARRILDTDEYILVRSNNINSRIDGEWEGEIEGTIEGG